MSLTLRICLRSYMLWNSIWLYSVVTKIQQNADEKEIQRTQHLRYKGWYQTNYFQ